MDCMQKKLSVLMFPWVGHGHISPFLELGKKLGQRNFAVYLCSTPVNLKSVEKKVGFEEDSSIQLIELHLPNLRDLPPYYHTTNGLPSHLMPTLKKAFDMSKNSFFHILTKYKPDLLVYDFLQPWAPEAAFKLDIPAVQFITSSTTQTAVLFHAYKKPDVEFPYSKIYYRDYEAAHVEELRKSLAAHKRDRSNLVIDCIEKSSKVVLIKGFNEIDDKYIRYLSTLCGKKVVPVGPLVQEPTINAEDENLETIKWLEKKGKASTVFVSFGSEYFLSDEDFEAVAQGLLQSQVNFIWVVRFPLGEDISLEDKLQKVGFYDKVGERGVVVEGWVPQAKILGHPSIGGFVSHCGWNSVIESMKFGVPIIAVPMHIDQPINARLVEEVGAGIEVLRSHDKKLEATQVASVIRRVLKDEFVRGKVNDLSDHIKMKRDEEIDQVAKELKKLCVQRKHAVEVEVEPGCRETFKLMGRPNRYFTKLGKQLLNLPR